LPQYFASKINYTNFFDEYSTATITNFVTLTAASVVPKDKRDGEIIKTIPAYASACSGSAGYSSACSCWGITVTTTTVFTGVGLPNMPLSTIPRNS
jgi:hypothetical protein